MRLINEFFEPKLKCDRVGHRWVSRNIRIRKPGDALSIATDYKAKQLKCSRCGLEGDPYDLEYITYYSSVTMPDSMWSELREKGYLILDK